MLKTHEDAANKTALLRDVNRGVGIMVSLFLLPIFLSTTLLANDPTWVKLTLGLMAQTVWVLAVVVVNSVLVFVESYHRERISED